MESKVDVERFVEKNKSVLYGTLLGDATIPEANGRNTLLQISHSAKQKDYLFYLYEIFSEVSHPPRFQDRGPDGSFWRFNTVRHKAWQGVWSTFHENSKRRDRAGRSYVPKIVNQRILDSLDDRGVAVWWMDDGFVSFTLNEETNQWNEFARLSTCDFTFEENELMLEWFGRTYGAVGTVQKQRVQKSDRVYPILYFNWQEFLKIAQRISPFVPSFMKYKVDVKAARIWMSERLLKPHGFSFEDGKIENVEERLRYGTGCGSYPA